MYALFEIPDHATWYDTGYDTQQKEPLLRQACGLSLFEHV